MTRYLSGLCVAGLGLCGGGWLVMAAVAFGGKTRGTPARVNLLTGAGLVIVSAAALCCWAVAWRQRMRADGVLGGRSAPAPASQPAERPASHAAERPAPQPPEHPASHSAELAGELRSLLGPLLSAVAAVEAVEGFGPPPANGSGHAAANGGGHAAANGNGHAAANGPAHAGQPVTAAFPSDGEESW